MFFYVLIAIFSIMSASAAAPTLLAGTSFNPTASQILSKVPYGLWSCGAFNDLSIYLNAPTILSQHCKKIEHPKMLLFAREECKYIIDRDINFYAGEAAHFGLYGGTVLAFAILNNSIVISSEYYKILEAIFNKEEITDQDKATLDIFRFILQHEAGHLKHNDSKTKTQLTCLLHATNIGLYYAVNKLLNPTGFQQIITFYALSAITTLVLSTLNNRQEWRADAGVKTKAALNGGLQFFKNLVRVIESNDIADVFDKLRLTHPSSRDRLARLESIMAASTP